MSAQRASAGSSCQGVALLDLLLVLTILGIVSAVAIRTPANNELQLDTAARELEADLLTAQSLALSTRTAFGLYMDTTTHTSWFVLGNGSRPADVELSLRSNPNLGSDEVERLLAARSRGERGWPLIRLATAAFGGSPQMTFEADGSARSGGLAELRLGATWLRVRVQAGSGRIVVTAP